jgi:hypothetical protein
MISISALVLSIIAIATAIALMVNILVSSSKHKSIVLEERTASTVQVVAGWNRRLFNNVTSDGLTYENGRVTLPPGQYHISGLSQFTAKTSSEMSAPGYAAVFKHMDPEKDSQLTQENILGIGSVVDSSTGIPSIVDMIINVEETMDITLEHQCRINDGEELYLGLYDEDQGSTSHVMARLTIIEL